MQARKSTGGDRELQAGRLRGKAKDAKVHTFHYTGAGPASGSASWDECSQNVSATWTRSVPCTDSAGAPAAPITVTASWGEELKPPLKTGSKSERAPVRVTGAAQPAVVTVTGQAAGRDVLVAREARNRVDPRNARCGSACVANLGSAQRICALNVDAETLFADD